MRHTGSNRALCAQCHHYPERLSSVTGSPSGVVGALSGSGGWWRPCGTHASTRSDTNACSIHTVPRADYTRTQLSEGGYRHCHAPLQLSERCTRTERCIGATTAFADRWGSSNQTRETPRLQHYDRDIVCRPTVDCTDSRPDSTPVRSWSTVTANYAANSRPTLIDTKPSKPYNPVHVLEPLLTPSIATELVRFAEPLVTVPIPVPIVPEIPLLS